MLDIFEYKTVEPAGEVEILFGECQISSRINCQDPTVNPGDEVPFIKVDFTTGSMKFLNDEMVEYASLEIESKVRVLEFT